MSPAEEFLRRQAAGAYRDPRVRAVATEIDSALIARLDDAKLTPVEALAAVGSIAVGLLAMVADAMRDSGSHFTEESIHVVFSDLVDTGFENVVAHNRGTRFVGEATL